MTFSILTSHFHPIMTAFLNIFEQITFTFTKVLMAKLPFEDEESCHYTTKKMSKGVTGPLLFLLFSSLLLCLCVLQLPSLAL